MNAYSYNQQNSKGQAIANNISQKQSDSETTVLSGYHQPESSDPVKTQAAANNSPRVQQLRAYQAMADNHTSPGTIKSGSRQSMLTSGKKHSMKPSLSNIYQRVVKMDETEFTPAMVYRYLTSYITGLKSYISKELLKDAIKQKCEKQDGRTEYTPDTKSARELLTELMDIARVPLEKRKPFPEEVVGIGAKPGREEAKSELPDLDTLMKLLDSGGNPVKAFREYMYDPASFYDKMGVVGERERLLDSTRRKIETQVAGELLNNAAKVIHSTTLDLINNLPVEILDIVKKHGGTFEGDESEILLFKIIRGEKVEIGEIAKVLESLEVSDQVSQFLSAFRLFYSDVESGSYQQSAPIVENILRNLAMIQVVNWMAEDVKYFEMEGIYTAVLETYQGLNPSYGKGRGRVPVKEDQKDNTATYPVSERGLTFDSHFPQGPSKKLPEQESKFPVFSAAGNSLPAELPRGGNTEALKARFENPGWLERARKHNQPFVNSISGICLMFRNIQEMYKKSVIEKGSEPPGKKQWHEMEVLLSAAIVYYPGGHSFHECIKGFKAGAQLSVDKDNITPEEHMAWKDFCYNPDFIPDDIIMSCLVKLKEALATPPETGVTEESGDKGK